MSGADHRVNADTGVPGCPTSSERLARTAFLASLLFLVSTGLGGASLRPPAPSHVATAAHPLHAALEADFAAWRREWGGLPAIVVSPGPALAEGHRGPRIAALRARLGLPPGRPFDEALTARVSAFQAAHGLPPTGVADAATLAALNRGPAADEAVIRANLRRTAAIPAAPGRRYVLVDAAAARLWMMQDGRPVDSMKVVVGAAAHPTPEMAGLIRYVVFRPYWNLPPDLVPGRVARLALRKGPAAVEAAGFEVLSGWEADARIIPPQDVDWQAVWEGRTILRVRQRPGPANMMGAAKFMFPNRQGIYLHDTPHRVDFAADSRTASAGCVRVEDAARLSRWLAGVTPPTGEGPPEQRMDLAEPVPVYIIYLTAAPAGGRIEFRPDVYGRDPV